ncbi:MAG: phosphoribosylaminoimidazolesuccinocarboxamide synthase [Acidobacteria bacterium]|nr:phosphoribosylaminoimidazolesuccinocarboxamide synthase [Acidobacteriota bacterium]
MHPTVWQTNFEGVTLRSRGKVRDMYDVGDALLMVASDRLSAFDVVLPTPIPDKGRVLTQLSLFWFEKLRDILQNHVLSAADFPRALDKYRDQLNGRAILVRKTEPLPVECVVRGYLSGSGWKDYKATGAVCGIVLPAGLQDSSQLPEPIFTPATKATSGHDENISFEQTANLLGRKRAEQARDVSIAIYRRASQYARERGIIIADTKFEFGLVGEELVWIDEALTPDSSRFWPAAEYAPGRSQPSFDKQYVRDYLERIGWNKQPPGPELPAEVVAGTRGKYREAYRLLTGHELS